MCVERTDCLNSLQYVSTELVERNWPVLKGNTLHWMSRDSVVIVHLIPFWHAKRRLQRSGNWPQADAALIRPRRK